MAAMFRVSDFDLSDDEPRAKSFTSCEGCSSEQSYYFCVCVASSNSSASVDGLFVSADISSEDEEDHGHFQGEKIEFRKFV